jgi:hypothetical protein
MRNKKFIALVIISNTGAKRYLYRETATNGKDPVIVGKYTDPVKTIEEIADYFFNVFSTNTFFEDTVENADLYEIILSKIHEISSRVSNDNKVSIVFSLAKDNNYLLLLNEKVDNSKTNHVLYSFNINTPNVNSWVIDSTGKWNDNGIWDDTKIWKDRGF